MSLFVPMPPFHVHYDEFWLPVADVERGWLTRGPDPAGDKVAYWYDIPPAPWRFPGARIEKNNEDSAFSGYTIVDAYGRRQFDGIPDEQTARELFAWLCPKE